MSTPLRPPITRPTAPARPWTCEDRENFYASLCPLHDMGIPFRACTCGDEREEPRK